MVKKIVLKLNSILSAKSKEIYTNLYQKKLRKKLKNKNVSIICSNCIGGIIYHRLGMQFLSPTINLYINQSDFIKFAINLKEYLQESLIFIETEHSFPVAKLGDITIHFNHYKSEADARDSWEKRKKRINYQNLFVIMYDKDGVSKEDLRKLKNINCKGICVISNSEYSDLSYVVKIPVNMSDPKQRYRLDFNEYTGIRRFEKYFDYVEWFNGGEEWKKNTHI